MILYIFISITQFSESRDFVLVGRFALKRKRISKVKIIIGVSLKSKYLKDIHISPRKGSLVWKLF